MTFSPVSARQRHLPIALLIVFTAVVFQQAAVASAANPCDRSTDANGFWLDEAHAYLNSRFCEPAIWFDDFFASDRVDEEGRPGSMVRWRNDFTQTEGQGFKFKTRLKFKVQLPKTSKRLKLVFESEEREELEDIPPSTDNEAGERLGLQYDFLQSVKNNLSLRISLSPSFVLRYRHTEPLDEKKLVRFTQEIFRHDSINGARMRIDLEKNLLDIKSVVRWTNEATVAEDIEGAELVTALALFQKLDKQSALSYESSITVATRPTTYTSNYRLGVRYRQSFYRKWLFFELAPQVTWPEKINSTGETILERHSVFAFTLRLEAYFENLN